MKRFIYVIFIGVALCACNKPGASQSGGESAAVKETPPPPMNSAAANFPYAEASKEKLYPLDSSKIVTTASGLKYIVVQEGQGNKPKKGQKIIAQYHGTLTDGTKFDSSYDRGQPFEFSIGQGQVIRGWDEGFMNFTPGTKAILIIPSELGYGKGGSGNIPANATLVFHVELLAINESPPPSMGQPGMQGMPGGM